MVVYFGLLIIVFTSLAAVVTLSWPNLSSGHRTLLTLITVAAFLILVLKLAGVWLPEREPKISTAPVVTAEPVTTVPVTYQEFYGTPPGYQDPPVSYYPQTIHEPDTFIEGTIGSTPLRTFPQ